MGEPTEPQDDRGASLSPSHAGQRPEVHDAHGVHSGGQDGLAVGPRSLPPSAFPSGEGDEQSSGPATASVLAGATRTIPVSPSSGGRTQAPALSPAAAEVPV